MKHTVVKGTELASLVGGMLSGEEVILEQDGKPVAKLNPVERNTGGVDFEGYARWRKENGIGRLLPDGIPADFDDPLPEDFLITPER